jgi:hypothetical protein
MGRKRNAETAELNPGSAYSPGPLNSAHTELGDVWHTAGLAVGTLYRDEGAFYDALPLVAMTSSPNAATTTTTTTTTVPAAAEYERGARTGEGA